MTFRRTRRCTSRRIEDATHPQALFVSSCDKLRHPGSRPAPKGLIKSTDGGANWTIVPSLEGVPVQDIAFDPNDHSHMVLVTSDMKVYQSERLGRQLDPGHDQWPYPEQSRARGIDHLQSRRLRSVDRLLRAASGGGSSRAGRDIYEPAPELAGRVASHPGNGSCVPRVHQCQLGLHLPVSQHRRRHGLGPVRPLALVWLRLARLRPDRSPDGCYIANDAVGVQKTTDGGATWEHKVQGLTALTCTSMAVSQADPLRVYATFDGPLGIYRSDDGTSTLDLPADRRSPGTCDRSLSTPSTRSASTWEPTPASTRAPMGATTGLRRDGAWLPSPRAGLFVTMAADPYQAGHLLASFGGGSYGVGHGLAVQQHRLRSVLAGRRREPGLRRAVDPLHRLRP